ncbi:MAG: serine/threonine protein kinase, partial [Candidatus Aureabacteria bacterium]|nr:serine/threonine protein kinase [Candidatus Auribacterota bacterium]
IDQFTSEAHFTGQLSHPNIIPVHDAGMDSEGRPFYVLKNTQGVMWDVLLHPKSDEEIKKAEKYSLSDHLEIMESVCNAVAFAHSRGVIHRDIKPANVLIGEFGEVIVMNWGLTISVEGSGRKGDLTETNAFGGTISYMSHEVARADAEKISRQSDIYLLGAILYEILTGHPPHQAKTVREALTAAMQNRINPPDEDAAIDSELMAIALKAMATEPSSRHASIIDFQKELKSYKAHEESRSLTENARLLMEHAQKHDKRIEFIRATVLLEEALQLWAGNTDAKELIEKIKKDHGSLQGEFNKNLVKLIVRGEIFNILFKTLIIPIYLMLLVLPFFFYFYVLWANPLYKIGKINVRQLDKWQQDKEVILSEHFIHNVYLLFDGNDLYQVVIHDNRIKMRRLNTSKLPEKAENKYYIESFEWIVKKAPFEIFVDELSLEIFAPDRRHPRVFNPLLLLKAKKSLNESRKN